MTSGNDADIGLSFTGRIAGWSARLRWPVIAGAILVLVLAIVGNIVFGVRTSNVFGAGEARDGQRLLEQRFDVFEPPSEILIFSNPNLSITDPDFRLEVEPLVDQLRGLDDVTSVFSYYDTELPFMASQDGHAVMAQVALEAGEQQRLLEIIDPIVITVNEANDAAVARGFEIGILGNTSGQRSFNKLIEEDFGKILVITLIGGLLILVLAFGAVVAAVIPLVMALGAIFFTVGDAVLVSRFYALNIYYYEMVVLIGLAVGIDYSLFVVNRFREERAAGYDKLDAIKVASNTTGRAVFYAGVTVAISLAGLVITNDALFIGLALGAVIVVLFAVIGSLTILPALLAVMGDSIDRFRIPFLGRNSDGRGFWGTITDAVLAKPAVLASITVLALLALSAPLFSMHIGFTPFNSQTVPENFEGKRALELMEEHFSLSATAPLWVVVDAGEGGDVEEPSVRSHVDLLLTGLEANEAFAPPFETRVNPDGNLVLVTVPVVGAEDEDLMATAVRTLREETIPAALQGSDNLVALVTDNFGGATVVDQRANVRAKTAYVFAFVLSLAFLLLLLMFRSLVIPIKAIALNLLSVGAAYGVLVLVFQWGFADSLLGFEASGVIEIFMPLFLFAVLFGLSMDYHMLLLNRVKEAYDSGKSNEESVSFGIRRTAVLITSAAGIMVLVFGAFATSSVMIFKQMGIGLGVAILIDATVIRAVLLPASMKLLDDWNWYLPSWLEWLPSFSPEGKASTEPAPASD